MTQTKTYHSRKHRDPLPSMYEDFRTVQRKKKCADESFLHFFLFIFLCLCSRSFSHPHARSVPSSSSFNKSSSQSQSQSARGIAFDDSDDDDDEVNWLKTKSKMTFFFGFAHLVNRFSLFVSFFLSWHSTTLSKDRAAAPGDSHHCLWCDTCLNQITCKSRVLSEMLQWCHCGPQSAFRQFSLVSAALWKLHKWSVFDQRLKATWLMLVIWNPISYQLNAAPPSLCNNLHLQGL